jgi:hypothetical protein
MYKDKDKVSNKSPPRKIKRSSSKKSKIGLNSSDIMKNIKSIEFPQPN